MMNKNEKQVALSQINDEEKALKELEKIYKKAMADCQKKIADLNAREDLQNLSSIIYQKKYQEAILNNLKEILQNIQTNQYKTIEEYLQKSYENGFIGNIWLMQMQTNVPFIMPINEEDVTRARTIDSQLSSKYYAGDPLKGKLEEDVDLLKTRVRSNISRGIASGKSWVEVAKDIASGMNNPFQKSMNDAMRITRTEGHRVNQQGYLDAGDKAKKAGADIVKQWDATLDANTRPWHAEADGQIREWDEYFIVMGEKLKAPSVGGSARNVINCRCQLLQRARWALGPDELQTMQDRAKFFGLDKTKDFEEYKKNYLKLPEGADTLPIESEQTIQDRLDSLYFQTSKLNGAMRDDDYKEYLEIVAKNPDISKCYAYADDLRQVVYKDGAGCFYNSGKLEFGYPSKSHIDAGMSKYGTVAHEYGHYFDTFARQPDKFDQSILTWDEMQAIKDGVGARFTTSLTEHFLSNSDKFLNAVRKDFEKIISDGGIREYCLSDGKRDVTAGIQDAVDGWGIGRILWGHGDKYYNGSYNRLKSWGNYGFEDPTKALKDVYVSLGFDASNQAKVKKIVRQYETTSELWANMISAETTGGKELETIKEKFPEAYTAMKEILGGIK